MKNTMRWIFVITVLLTVMLCVAGGLAEEDAYEGLLVRTGKYYVQGNNLTLTVYPYIGEDEDRITKYEVVIWDPVQWDRNYSELISEENISEEGTVITIDKDNVFKKENDNVIKTNVLTVSVFAVDDTGAKKEYIDEWSTTLPVFTAEPDLNYEPRLVLFSDTVQVNSTFEAAVYAPGAETIIITAGKETWTMSGELGFIQAWFSESGTKTVSAVIGYANGTRKTLSETFTVSTKAGDLGKMETDFPGNLTSNPTVTIKPASGAPNSTTSIWNVFYDFAVLDLTDCGKEIYTENFARDADAIRELAALEENQQVSLASLPFKPGHMYRLQVTARCVGYPDLTEKTDLVMPLQENVERKITVSFVDAPNESTKNVQTEEDIRIRITLADGVNPKNVLIFNGWDQYDDLHDWGCFDPLLRDRSVVVNYNYDSGDWVFYAMAEIGDEKYVSNVLSIHASSTKAKQVPTITIQKDTVTRGDFLQIQVSGDDVEQAEAWAGRGTDWFWNMGVSMNADGTILYPTALLEPGVYNLMVINHGEGYDSASAYTTFRVVERENFDGVFLTADVTGNAWTNQWINFYGYVDDAVDAVSFKMYNGDKEISGDMNGDVLMWGNQWDEPCELNIYAEATLKNGNKVRNEAPLHISIKAKGELAEPVITTEAYLPANGFVFTVSGLTTATATVYGEQETTAQVPVNWWDGGVYDETGNHPVTDWNMDDPGENAQFNNSTCVWTFTVPENALTPNHVYNISFGMGAENYLGSRAEIRVPVIDAVESETKPTLAFYGEAPESNTVKTGETISLVVTAPAGTKSVVFFDGNRWDYRDKNDDDPSTDFLFSREFTSGNYRLFAMASPSRAEDGTAWEDLTEWTVSNTLSITVESDGELDKPQIISMDQTVQQGEILTVVVGKVDGADWYDLNIKDGNNVDVYQGYLSASAAKDDKLTFRIPTLWLEVGNTYWVEACVSKKNWDGNSTEWGENQFEVTMAAALEEDVLIQTDKTEGKAYESLILTAQAKEINGLTGFEIIYDNETWVPNDNEMEEDISSGRMTARLEMKPGEAEIYVIAHYGDDPNNDKASDKITIKTEAPKEMTLGFHGLTEILDLSDDANQNNDFSFQVTGLSTAQQSEKNRWWSVDINIRGQQGGVNFNPNNSPNTDTFVIPKEMLQAGNVIQINAGAHAYGYEDAHADFSMLVIRNTENNELSLTINNSAQPYPIKSNTEFNLTVSGIPEGTTGLRIFTGEDWEWMDLNNQQNYANGVYTSVWRWESGEYNLIAQYTTDDKAPAQMEWNGTYSNPVTLKVTADGEVTTGEVKLNKEIFTRSELLEITFAGGTNTESWTINICDANGWDCMNPINPHEPGTVSVPMAALSEGNYEAVVKYNGKAGYDSKEVRKSFRVSDEEISGMIFTLSQTEGCVHDQVIGAAYYPGADYYMVYISNNGTPYNNNDGISFQFELYPNTEYVKVEAYKNGQEQPIDTREISLTVNSFGEMPVGIVIPTIIDAIKENSFAVSGLDDADWYWEVTVFHQEGDESNPNWVNDLNWSSAKGDEPGQFTIPANSLNPGQEYNVYVRADAYGYETGQANAGFMAVNSSNETITLTVNGQTGEIAEPLWANENITVEVTAPGAQRIRYYNPGSNGWEEATESQIDENGTAKFDLALASGVYTLTATACYSENETKWEGVSNAVCFSVDSLKNVGAPELVFGTGTDNPTVAVGESLPVTIVAGENATEHQIQFFQIIGEGNEQHKGWKSYYGLAGENVGINIMTGDLGPGSYYLQIGSKTTKSNWAWSDKRYQFTVTEGTGGANLEVSQHKALLGSDIEYAIHGFGENDILRIHVTIPDKPDWGSRDQDWHTYNSEKAIWQGQFTETWEEGQYILQVQKNTGTQDEPNWQDQEDVSKTVTIRGNYGKLSAPYVTVSSLVMPGDSLTFSFDEVENAQWYNVYIFHYGENNDYIEDFNSNQSNMSPQPGQHTIDQIEFTEGITYYLTVSAWAKGYVNEETQKELICGDVSHFIPFNMTLPKKLKQVDAEAFAGIDMTVVIISGTNTALDLSFLNEYGTRYVVATEGAVTVPDNASFEVITPEKYQKLIK